MVVSIIIQILLGLGFIMFGYQKFVSPDMKEGFKYFGYTDSFRIFTGLIELVGAVLLIGGIWLPNLALIGAALLAVTMIGAILTHVKIKDTIQGMMMPIILFVLSSVVLVIQIVA